MKTFKEFLVENANGNYVCIDVQHSLKSFFAHVGLQEPVTGQSPPDGDYHCTLIYSPTTYSDPDKVMQNLKRNFADNYVAKIHSFECFDSTPKDGERDSEKSCIVMKLHCPELMFIHRFLQSLGLQHTYNEFQPHVTLKYNMSVEEAHFYKDKLNALNLDMLIDLQGFKSQAINKNYV